MLPRPSAKIVAIILAVTFIIVVVPRLVDKIKPRLFDSAVWKLNTGDREKDATRRLRMVDHLLLSQHLVGKRKDAIDQLLGVPPVTFYYDYDYVYYLGEGRWLLIKFKDDVVVTAKYEAMSD